MFQVPGTTELNEQPYKPWVPREICPASLERYQLHFLKLGHATGAAMKQKSSYLSMGNLGWLIGILTHRIHVWNIKPTFCDFLW